MASRAVGEGEIVVTTLEARIALRRRHEAITAESADASRRFHGLRALRACLVAGRGPELEQRSGALCRIEIEIRQACFGVPEEDLRLLVLPAVRNRSNRDRQPRCVLKRFRVPSLDRLVYRLPDLALCCTRLSGCEEGS